MRRKAKSSNSEESRLLLFLTKLSERKVKENRKEAGVNQNSTNPTSTYNSARKIHPSTYWTTKVLVRKTSSSSS